MGGGSGMFFDGWERRRAEVDRHNENSGRIAEAFARMRSVGQGSIAFEERVDFGMTFIEEPYMSYGSRIDPDDLDDLLGSNPTSTLQTPLPICQGYVVDWDQDDRGFYTGAWVGVRVWFPYEANIWADLEVEIFHHYSFKAVAIKDVPVDINDSDRDHTVEAADPDPEDPPGTDTGGDDSGGDPPPVAPPDDGEGGEGGGTDGGGGTPIGPGPYVTPRSSKKVHEAYGICQHVNFQTAGNIHAGATNQAAIMARYGQMKVHQMRSMYVPSSSAAFAAAVNGCRTYGVKWNALVAARKEDGSISPSEAQIRARIQSMADNHADIIGWIEGINEPNVPGDSTWVDKVLEVQWIIWDEWQQHPDELGHVKILSPSMHDTRLDAVNGAHWSQFANASITRGGDTFQGKDLCHMAAVHNYPGGTLPDTKRAERIQWVYDAFGSGFPVKLTEWGYTTALNKSGRIGGHKVTSEAAAAAYSAQGILDHARLGYELLQYEFMDDPNSANNDTEKNFGQWKVTSATGSPSGWIPKRSVAAITDVLTGLKDPGSNYSTVDVTLDTSEIPAGVRWLVTQKRTGVTTLWLWRHAEMWNPITEDPITVGTVQVPITDIAGERTITVGTMPVAVNVRLS